MNEKTQSINLANDETEIDLKEIFFILRAHLILIIAVMVLFGTGAGVATKLLITPKYQSTSMLYVLSSSTSITSIADIQIGSYLTNDYIVLIKSRPVLDTVIDDLNLNESYNLLKSRVNVVNSGDNTRIVSITVTDEDPEQAKLIVDKITDVAKVQMATIMHTEQPSVAEYGTVNTKPVSPSLKKNVAIAVVLGFVLVAGFLIVLYILDDTIDGRDDVEKYLGLNTLGLIPYDETVADEESKKNMTKAKKIKHIKGKK